MSRQEVRGGGQNEVAMLAAFRRQVADILARQDEFRKTEGEMNVGLEVEYGLVDDSFNQVEEVVRNAIKDENREFIDVELGAAQIELRTDPHDLREGSEISLSELKVREDELVKSAKNRRAKLISSGTNPFVPTRGIVRTDLPKYKQVPDFHNDRQRPGLNTTIGRDERVDIGDAAMVGISNSVQLNIEASGPEDAVDKVNRSLMIGPMVVALTANSRFLEQKDTGIQDVRMIAWETSHDTRTAQQAEQGMETRVGLPKKYYTSLADYFKQIEKYPFILDNTDAAIFIGIGLNWRDARIKVRLDTNSLLVEFRPVSTQSTPEENFAAMMFYYGRTLWSQQQQETLLPMKLVEENRNEAMTKGSLAKLWTNTGSGFKKMPVSQALQIELRRSRQALVNAGLMDKELSLALDSLQKQIAGGSPSEQLARLREAELVGGEEELGALVSALISLGGLRT